MLPISAHASGSAGLGDESDMETYLLLLLSDSNLPTGGFVASSGLESFYAHGLLHNSRPTAHLGSTSTTVKRTVAPSQAQLSSATLSFAQSTLHSYARSSFPFLARVHAAVNEYLDYGVRAKLDRDHARQRETPQESTVADTLFEQAQRARLDDCLRCISHLDYSYHTLLLNHVARRASKAQGIALLTLYSKAFAKPIDLQREAFPPPASAHANDGSAAQTSTSAREDPTRIALAAALVDRLKLDIRRSSATAGRQNGHLPVCWAVFAACLGLSLRKAVFLHLFLQARSLFSSSIRLNTLGPYLAHQVMRFQMQRVVDGVLQEMEDEGCLTVPAAEPSRLPASTAGTVEKQKGEAMQVDGVDAYTIADDTASAQPKQNSNPRLDRGKPFRTTASMSSSPHTRHPLRPKVQALRTGKGRLIPVDDDDDTQGWAWDWPEEQDDFLATGNETVKEKDSEKGFWTAASAPATTFPLGEIIQARHDQLHSRLFNS